MPKALEGQLLGLRQLAQLHLLALPSLVHFEEHLQHKAQSAVTRETREKIGLGVRTAFE